MDSFKMYILKFTYAKHIHIYILIKFGEAILNKANSGMTLLSLKPDILQRAVFSSYSTLSYLHVHMYQITTMRNYSFCFPIIKRVWILHWSVRNYYNLEAWNFKILFTSYIILSGRWLSAQKYNIFQYFLIPEKFTKLLGYTITILNFT